MKKSSKITMIALLLFASVVLFSFIANTTVLAAESVFSITSLEATEKSETTEVGKLDFDKTTMNANIVFHKVEDYAKVKITIKNGDSQSYKIKSISDNNDNDFITYEYSDYADKEIKSGSTADFYVTIKYTKELEDVSKRVQETGINISITLEDEAGNVVTEQIILNPKTGDAIYAYVAMCTISVIAMVVIAVYGIKGKKGKKLFGLLIALIVLTPAVAKAAEGTLVLYFNNKISLNDKIVVAYTDESGKETTTVVDYNDSYETPEAPEKEGYDFDGWYDESGEKVENVIGHLRADLKLTPKFTPTEYTITYDLDGGTAETVSTYTIESDDITLPEPTKAGHSFDGWTGSNGSKPQKEVTIAKGSKGNKSYTANWTLIEYKITYDLDGGTITEQPTTYNIDTETFTLPKPTKEDWVFIGWTGTGLDGRTRDVTITKGSVGDRNYTANWSKGAPKEIGTYHPSSSEVYMFFGAFTAEWKSTDETSGTYGWNYDCPALLFETDITRARLGFSKTEYVTYNYQREGLGFVAATNKKRMWFSDDYGAPSDGYYTVGYTTESIDHEMRFRVVNGQITDLQMIY